MESVKRVVITGATSGVGLSTAMRFAKEGWAVIGTARNAEKAERAQREAGANAESVSWRFLELRDGHAIDSVCKSILSEGPVDALVNNAGLAVYGPIDEADDGSIALQFEANVLAPIRMIRALAPSMRARGSGAVINVSSGSGFMAQPFDGLYASSKHALEGL